MKELSLSSFSKIQLGKADVDLTLSSLPSSSSILLSLVAVFVLVSFFRLLFSGLRDHLAFVKQRKQSQEHRVPPTVPSEKSSDVLNGPAPSNGPKFNSSWLWGLLQWESLPALPLDINERRRAEAIGRGAGVGFSNEKREIQPSWASSGLQQPQPRRPSPPMMSQVSPVRRTGPAFDRPLPAIYQSEAPVSMAKMIMSRHTFRRPTSRPPPARSSNAIQIQRKTPLLPRTTPQVPPVSTIHPPKSSLSRPPSPPSRSPSPPSPSHSRSPSPPSSRPRSRSTSRSPSPPLLPTSYSPPTVSESLSAGSAASSSGASIV